MDEEVHETFKNICQACKVNVKDIPELFLVTEKKEEGYNESLGEQTR
jgi:hypothetical protein